MSVEQALIGISEAVIYAGGGYLGIKTVTSVGQVIESTGKQISDGVYTNPPEQTKDTQDK